MVNALKKTIENVCIEPFLRFSKEHVNYGSDVEKESCSWDQENTNQQNFPGFKITSICILVSSGAILLK